MHAIWTRTHIRAEWTRTHIHAILIETYVQRQRKNIVVKKTNPGVIAIVLPVFADIWTSQYMYIERRRVTKHEKKQKSYGVNVERGL